VLYKGVPRLLQEIAVSRLDGRYNKLIAPINKCEVLILDDLLISPVSRDEQRELLEIVEERYDRKASVITSQLPVRAWHDAMQGPTLADNILDRLVHNSYKLELRGESMRRKQSLVDQKIGIVTD
jgi:DNA replication protein DnaC